MSNTRALQKQAAEYFFAGYTTHQIAEKLAIRKSTIMRWCSAPYFLSQLETLKKLSAQEMEMDLIHLARGAIDGLRTGLQMGIDLKDSHTMIAALKNMDKFRIFAEETPSNKLKPPKTARKRQQTAPNSAPLASNSTEPATTTEPVLRSF